MKTIFFRILIITLPLIATPFPAIACECWPVSSANEALKSSTLVFEGEAIQIQRFALDKLGKGYKEFAVKFRVVKVWKGAVQDYHIVRTASEKENCGFEFKSGEVYIVYAVGGPIPLATRCSRTTPITTQSANNDLKVLGPGKEN